jgi:pyrimidine-nucleoside phosphorylase
VLTDMNSPLGYSIGNWAEVVECIEIMDPERKVSALSRDLLEVTLFLAGAMLKLGGKSDSIEYGIKLAGEKLVSGECFAKFTELVEMQGGKTAFIKDPEKYPKAKFEKSMKAAGSGYISGLDAQAFGLAAVELGCGRKRVDDKIDYSSSILLKKKPGGSISAGETVCSIMGESMEQVEAASKIAEGGISISRTKPEISSRIIEVIT